MPGLSFSELFRWKSKADADDVVLEDNGWILKQEDFEKGEMSMPYTPLYVITTHLKRIKALGPRWDFRCFYDRDRIIALVSTFTSFSTVVFCQAYFRCRPLQYFFCAPPAFIAPYLWTHYDQTLHVTYKVLLGDGSRCPLCCMFRGGIGMLVTSALTSFSLSSVLSYGSSYLFNRVQKLPAPNDLNGLTRMSAKFWKRNSVFFLTVFLANFTFGFYFSYLQVSAFHTLHKADVFNAQRIEFEKQRKLE